MITSYSTNNSTEIIRPFTKINYQPYLSSKLGEDDLENVISIYKHQNIYLLILTQNIYIINEDELTPIIDKQINNNVIYKFIDLNWNTDEKLKSLTKNSIHPIEQKEEFDSLYLKHLNKIRRLISDNEIQISKGDINTYIKSKLEDEYPITITFEYKNRDFSTSYQITPETFMKLSEVNVTNVEDNNLDGSICHNCLTSHTSEIHQNICKIINERR